MKRQPLTEGDYQVLTEALGELLLMVDDPKRSRRLSVLRRRLAEFGDDLRNARVSKERFDKSEAERRAREPELIRQAQEMAHAKLLARYPEDEPGPWILFRPNENFDLHGGSHSDVFDSVVVGPWKEAAEKAWENRLEVRKALKEDAPGGEVKL